MKKILKIKLANNVIRMANEGAGPKEFQKFKERFPTGAEEAMKTAAKELAKTYKKDKAALLFGVLGLDEDQADQLNKAGKYKEAAELYIKQKKLGCAADAYISAFQHCLAKVDDLCKAVPLCKDDKKRLLKIQKIARILKNNGRFVDSAKLYAALGEEKKAANALDMLKEKYLAPNNTIQEDDIKTLFNEYWNLGRFDLLFEYVNELPLGGLKCRIELFDRVKKLELHMSQGKLTKNMKKLVKTMEFPLEETLLLLAEEIAKRFVWNAVDSYKRAKQGFGGVKGYRDYTNATGRDFTAAVEYYKKANLPDKAEQTLKEMKELLDDLND